MRVYKLEGITAAEFSDLTGNILPGKVIVQCIDLVTKLIKNVTGKVVPLEAPDSENKRALLALADELTDADLKELIKYADYLTAKKLKEESAPDET